MPSDLFLHREYLVENLTWIPRMYNRSKCSAFTGVGEGCETPAIVPLPGRPLRLCVDAYGSMIQALKTTNVSLIFSWPLTDYLIPFYHLKLSSGHLLQEAFHDS